MAPWLIAMLAALALGGKKGKGGGAVASVGPWGSGTPPQPIAEGQAWQPKIVSLLAEMDAYFADQGINMNWISAKEVTRLRKWGRQAIPPRKYWPRMAATILYGFQPIRQELAAPISIQNGYRTPEYNAAVGGEEGSRHVYFEALDMLPAPDLQNKQALLAAQRYIRFGEKLRMGLGVYGTPGDATNIHIDTGFRQRTWREADYWIGRLQQA